MLEGRGTELTTPSEEGSDALRFRSVAPIGKIDVHFDDTKEHPGCAGWRLAEIWGQSGSMVDQLGFTWVNADGKEVKGNAHGGPGGKKKSIDLAIDEHVTEIRAVMEEIPWDKGNHGLKQVEFVVAGGGSQRKLVFGNDSGGVYTQFIAPIGYEFFGLRGGFSGLVSEFSPMARKEIAPAE